jgi:hypothetical protein
VAGLQKSSVQTRPSSHTIGAPGLQSPPPHVSPSVQAFPSLQASVLFVKTQPEAGSQLSSVHTLASSQTVAGPGWQLPAPHVSPDVQAFPSSQLAVLSVWKHPVAGSHWSSVQTLPSLHSTAVVSVKTQPVAGTQVSAVQTLASSQTTAVPGWQLPPPQVSPVVHALASSHGDVLSWWKHPDAGLHRSSVQMLLSLHAAAVVSVKTHPEAGSQVSAVHALPSLHEAELSV